jgi:hypothetical protein
MLTQWASWRWVMFVNVPIGLAILLLTPRHVRESERHPGRFDLAGALASCTGVTALAWLRYNCDAGSQARSLTLQAESPLSTPQGKGFLRLPDCLLSVRPASFRE